MAKARLILACCAALAALPLGGCDREADEEVQETVAVEPHSQTTALTGVMDDAFTGESVPEVTVTDPDGDTLALHEVGEPMLLNVWATWCAPCVVEMPLLDELAAELEGQVRVVTVSEDMRGAEVVQPFFEENDLPNLPQWLDPENDLAFAFGGGPVLPLTVLYDAEGREIWRVIGAYDWASEEARAQVLEALAASDG
ncbi:TlpA family protein disulfide reductase [Aurantiacibacter gangjinensis]|uniref:Thiol:disulfide interchange protein n=1 Tax=Aurantiacibacter gangjinensis TaxID=502682 RepID=A0A0G9MN00_9SPHN|nr:TlpA disulfide reductase family protein [Aurantiacibacter gangjinensis]KLE32087.1 thiol:disulfide interchange protein [Aurantiacibacter gangjinensis]